MHADTWEIYTLSPPVMMMDLSRLRAEYAARLTSLFAELYTLPAAPEMAAQHADIVHTIDAQCEAYREALRQTRPGMRPA